MKNEMKYLDPLQLSRYIYSSTRPPAIINLH